LILVTRLDGSKYYVNPDEILFLESTPDTVIITLKTNLKFVVKDKVENLLEQFIQYQQKIHAPFTERLNK
jgi:flagellar protein FlbD